MEAVSGKGLDAVCREKIYQPLNLNHLGFNPLRDRGALTHLTENRKPKTENRSYAATEPGLIPGRNICGEVHDENAWAAGGVAGHSGLFGRGREVFKLVGRALPCLPRPGGTAFPSGHGAPLFNPAPGSDPSPGFRHPRPGGGPKRRGPLFLPR